MEFVIHVNYFKKNLHKTQICNSPFSVRAKQTTTTLNCVPWRVCQHYYRSFDCSAYIRIAMTVGAHFGRGTNFTRSSPTSINTKCIIMDSCPFLWGLRTNPLFERIVFNCIPFFRNHPSKSPADIRSTPPKKKKTL